MLLGSNLLCLDLSNWHPEFYFLGFLAGYWRNNLLNGFLLLLDLEVICESIVDEAKLASNIHLGMSLEDMDLKVELAGAALCAKVAAIGVRRRS